MSADGVRVWEDCHCHPDVQSESMDNPAMCGNCGNTLPVLSRAGSEQTTDKGEDPHAEAIRALALIARMGQPEGAKVKWRSELIDREQVVEQVVRLRSAIDALKAQVEESRRLEELVGKCGREQGAREEKARCLSDLAEEAQYCSGQPADLVMGRLERRIRGRQ